MLNEFGVTPDAQPDSIEAFLSSDAHFGIAAAPLSAGFGLPGAGLAFLTENDLYPGLATTGRRGKRDQERASNVEAMVRDLSELRAGDPVVHAQHGIGRYHGLVNMDMGEGEMEFLHLEYANGSTLYVPVSQLHVIARYSGADPEAAPLHQLGSGQWDKARRKAAKQVRDTAAELLALYAQRTAREGYAFKLPLNDYEAFAEGFGFEETADQAAAIQAVIADMTSGRPMDRLVCGDVGFGKTVALRAAFLAVANGKQVALLCPTTLLAEQHAQTFSDRFADWPVRVVELSRFRSAKEVATAIEGINDGRVDIVIGTHKILSKDVKFKRLGLVIIDEEHRFGVRQKEALKALRAEVDVLTLTATPIPRTLGMSLEGIRDFSVIATAPQKRLAIKTFVRREDGSTLREALLRELARRPVLLPAQRGRDHPQPRAAGRAGARGPHRRGPWPDARARAGAGDEGLLPAALQRAAVHDHHRDRHRRAQRQHHRDPPRRPLRPGPAAPAAWPRGPFAPPGLRLPADARRRRHHQQCQEAPGSDSGHGRAGLGLLPAMHDLEIRGTGEVLGDSQSGNIQEVGFSMYNEMLNECGCARARNRT